MENTPADPIVVQTPASTPPSNGNTPQENKKNAFRISGSVASWAIKVIFAILILIIIYQVFRLITSVQTPPPPVGQIQPVSGGTIALFADKKEYQIGEVIPVEIKLSTGGYSTGGTDVVLKYDPQVLEASGSGVFVTGDIYAEYPVAMADPKSGTISISGISALSESGFNGTGVFARLNLKAKTPGTTSLVIDYQPGGTADSNITKDNSSEDVLEKVFNLDLVIR